MCGRTRVTAPVPWSRAPTRSIRRSVPEPPCPLVAVRASPLRGPWGAAPRASSGRSSGRVFWRLALPRRTAGGRSLPFGPSRRLRRDDGLGGLLAPPRGVARSGLRRARPRSARDPSPHPRRLDVAWALTTRASRSLARSPCPAPPPLRCVCLAARCARHASSPRSVTLTQVRVTSLAVVRSREDFHLQDRAHAGRTNKKPLANSVSPGAFLLAWMTLSIVSRLRRNWR